MATSTTYLPSLNYPGSSGYDNSGNKLTTKSSYASTSDIDYGVYDVVTGKVVSLKTGQPWNGTEPRTGTNYVAGVAQTTDTTSTDTADRYKAVDVVKQPEVATATTDLMKTFQEASKNSLDDFNSYLESAKAQATNALTAAKDAANITPTVNALTSAQQQYNAALGANAASIGNINATNEANQRAIVQQAMDQLAAYDEAQNRAQQLALAQVTNAVSRYGAGKNYAAGGVNLGLGGDVARIAANSAYSALQPYEMAKINQRYNILQNLSLPVEADIANRATSAAAQYLPALQASQYNSAQGTAQAIQALKQAAANQDWQTVQQLMSVPQLAASVRQSILSGDASLLSALSQLYGASHYYGLEDTQGVNVSQPQYYSMYTGPYSTNKGTSTGGGSTGGTMNTLATGLGNTGTGESLLKYNNRGIGYGTLGGGLVTPTASGGGGVPTSTYYNPTADTMNYSYGLPTWYDVGNQGAQSGMQYNSAYGTITDANGVPVGIQPDWSGSSRESYSYPTPSFSWY